MPPIKNQRIPLPFVGALSASLLIAVLLSACGGSAAETTQPPVSSSDNLAKPHGRAVEGSAKRTPRQAEKAGTKGATGSGLTSQTKPESQRSSPTPANQPPTRGCPPGMSDRICRETAAAKTRQEESPPHQASEKKRCPDSLSKAECQGLVSNSKTGEPKPESSSPAECPPALSTEQCAELEERYEEATR